MKFETHIPGELVGKTDIAEGDLFIIGRGPQLLLAMRVQGQPNINLAVILTDLGPSDGPEWPRLDNFDALVQSDELARKISDGLVIDPVAGTAVEVFQHCVDRPSPNGLLALYTGGRKGIYVRPSDARGATYNLADGSLLQPELERQFVHWRLSWANGALTIPLYDSRLSKVG